MKHTLLILAVAFTLLASAGAQNLLVNGDFETGQLTPWTGGTVAADPDGGFLCTSAGTISQPVTTTAGTRYLVAADLLVSGPFGSSATITASKAVGGGIDGTRSIPFNTFSPSVVRGSLVFTATSNSTIISFAGFNIGLPGNVTVDDAVMLEVEPTTLDGRYKGSITTTVAVATLELSNKSARKITARITDDNSLYILEGTQAIYSGTVLNDGTFELLMPSGPVGGKGKVRGKRIELQFNSNPLFAFDPKNAPIANTVSNKLVLTRR